MRDERFLERLALAMLARYRTTELHDEGFLRVIGWLAAVGVVVIGLGLFIDRLAHIHGLQVILAIARIVRLVLGQHVLDLVNDVAAVVLDVPSLRL